MPSISMSLDANYVVQTSVYSRLAAGIGRPLSDRRIKQLQAKGWYGSGILALQRKEKIKKTKKVLDLRDLI